MLFDRLFHQIAHTGIVAGGKPREMAFFAQLLRAGHRIISISYNTKEAIQRVCPRRPDAECAAKVRRKRIYGENTIDVIDDKPNEALAIPASNIRVWTAVPDTLNGPNPYHGVGVSRFNSAQNIAFMFGL
ncbi:MAG: hypothetical protein ABJC26_18435 [Gemmatimonadaceae bacterium]